MKEERLQILKMIEERKITADEGAELLEALDSVEYEPINNLNPKWLKIKVYDPDNNTRANITLPLALMNVGMKMIGKFAPSFVPELKDAGFGEEDLEELFNTIKDGAVGKIVDVESEDGEKVEIIVE